MADNGGRCKLTLSNMAGLHITLRVAPFSHCPTCQVPMQSCPLLMGTVSLLPSTIDSKWLWAFSGSWAALQGKQKITGHTLCTQLGSAQLSSSVPKCVSACACSCVGVCVSVCACVCVGAGANAGAGACAHVCDVRAQSQGQPLSGVTPKLTHARLVCLMQPVTAASASTAASPCCTP